MVNYFPGDTSVQDHRNVVQNLLFAEEEKVLRIVNINPQLMAGYFILSLIDRGIFWKKIKENDFFLPQYDKF